MADSAVAFYGDGSKLQEIYGNSNESFDQAAAKFHNSNAMANFSGKDQIHLSYHEARSHAYGQ